MLIGRVMFPVAAGVPVVSCCSRWSCFKLASLTVKHWRRGLSQQQLKNQETNQVVGGGVECREHGEPLNFFQQSFKPYQDLVEAGKRDAKNYILVEDKTGQLILEKRQELETILDSPVSDYWDYWISNKHYILVKLTDFADFRSKIGSFISGSNLPLYSKSYCITKLPTTQSTSTRVINDLLVGRNKARSYKNFNLEGKLDDSMRLFINNLAMNDLECRLRFFVINQLEQILCDGVFAAFQLVPYGSSFNGLGWGESALDLCLTPSCDFRPNKDIISQSDVYGPMKRKKFIQAYENLLKDDLFPGIRNPKVPHNHFMKFFSTTLFTDVTITCSDPDESLLIDMAAIIFDITKSDERIYHLLHFCKLWTRVQGIANLRLNNFLLTMLTINYLQTRLPFPILPPMEVLLRNKDNPKDGQNKLTLKTKESFSEILVDYFNFIVTFDFANHGFSPLTGKTVRKRIRDPLYLEDPASGTNMANKVTNEDLRTLCENAKISCKILASGQHPSKLLESFK